MVALRSRGCAYPELAWEDDGESPLRRTRIDLLLVERGLAESRHKAQALVMAGEVLVDGQPATKAGRPVAADATIRLLRKRARFVGRGGEKLDAAMEHFGIDVRGLACLDVGASTGGFTDCLLQRGAARVHAVDVGTNQLHWSLRCDARVHVLERFNARYLTLADLGERVAFACCDVSFISAARIIDRLPLVVQPAAEAVVLAKPQFEVGRGEVGRGGVVRDRGKQLSAAASVCDALRRRGFRGVAWLESPLVGPAGNHEFLVHGTHRSGLSEGGVE